jgi:integrase/recombinase XerD
MKNENGFPGLLERFFTQRLIAQRRVSSHTIASYRDTFRLLLQFVEKRLHKPPSGLALTDLDTSWIGAFLDELEKDRGNGARSRNLRLTAIRSFYQFAAYEEPTQSGLIPDSAHSGNSISFLTGEFHGASSDRLAGLPCEEPVVGVDGPSIAPQRFQQFGG